MSYSTPEGKVKKKGREICRKLGLYGFPVQQGGTSNSGIPDDCYCVNGRFVFIEYKAHIRRGELSKAALKSWPTARQVKHMEECRKAGGITLVVDDENIDSLESALSNLLSPDEYIVGTWWRSKCAWLLSVEEYMDFAERVERRAK